MKCKSCNAEIPENSLFCPQCGAKIDEITAEKKSDGKNSGNGWILIVVALTAVIIGAYILFQPDMDIRGKMQKKSAVSPAQDKVGRELEKLLARAEDEPENSELLTEIGNIYFDSHNFAQALIYYQKSLKYKPDNPDVLIDAGVCFFNVGNLDKAMSNFERALEIDPNHPVGLYNLGVVYSNKGDHQRAAELWHKILKVAPDSPQAEAIRQMLNSQKSSNL